MNRTPEDSVDPDAATILATSVCRFVRGGNGGGGAFCADIDGEFPTKESPVAIDTMWRKVRDRHSIVRDIRAGRECQLRNSVPKVRTTRLVVII